MPLGSVMHVKGCHMCKVTHTCRSPEPLQALTAYWSCQAIKEAFCANFRLKLHAAFVWNLWGAEAERPEWEDFSMSTISFRLPRLTRGPGSLSTVRGSFSFAVGFQCVVPLR